MTEVVQAAAAVVEKPKKLKGNASWRPVSEDLIGRQKGFDYRKVRFDNVNRLLKQGWELVENKDGDHTVVDGGNRIFGGKRIDGLAGGVGFVYMRLPDDGASARNEYRDTKAQRAISSLQSNAQRAVGIETHEGAPGTHAKGVEITRGNVPIKQVID